MQTSIIDKLAKLEHTLQKGKSIVDNLEEKERKANNDFIKKVKDMDMKIKDTEEYHRKKIKQKEYQHLENTRILEEAFLKKMENKWEEALKQDKEQRKKEENTDAEEDEVFCVCGKTNSEMLNMLLASYPSMADFLSDDDANLSLHSTNVTEQEQDGIIKKSFDIDGLIMELGSLAAIKCPLHYLSLKTDGKYVLHPFFHVLKKHIPISQYSGAGLQCLRNIQAIHISYTDGWRISLCLIPKGYGTCNSISNIETARMVSLDFFQRYRENVLESLQTLSSENMNRPTIKKNSLHEISSMNILPQDQEFVLNLFDKALEKTNTPSDLKVMRVVTKFGQKQTEALNLSNMCNISEILSLSVHTACNLDAREHNTHLLWARRGIQEVIGTRGKLFSCLSLSEAANFQSNLDSQAIDVTRDVRCCAKFPSKVTFIQLYSDTPHKRNESYYPHPISGVITCAGALHPNTSRAMMQRSEQYLANMKDNAMKLCGITTCRVEIVTRLEQADIQDNTIRPNMFFDESNITKLLENHPMLLPFHEDEGQGSFIGNVRNIVTYLISKLQKLYESNKNQGGFLASWESYQLELSLEILFWGNPMLQSDAIFATNLGPATNSERSITYQRGIIGLSPPQSATLPGSPPPLKIWTKSDVQIRRVRRIFSFSDCLEGSNAVIGRNLLTILLSDLYDPVHVHLHTLQGQNPPPQGICVGSISLEQLVKELSTTSRFQYPGTYGRATKILQNRSTSIDNILRAGIHEIGITYFPAITFIDASRNPKASWNGRNFWQIILPNTSTSIAAQAGEVTQDVIRIIESKKYTFTRNLLQFKERGMPWILPVLRRLADQSLSRAQQVQICTFVSCVAFLQQGIYVDYNLLSNLEQDLPLNQLRLRQLEIQSKFLFPGIRIFRLWRLHENIPFKLTKAPCLADKRRPAQWVDYDREMPDDLPDPCTETKEAELVTKFNKVNLPARWNKPWSSLELDMLNESMKGTMQNVREFYQQYSKLCVRHNIAVRTYQSFRQKIRTYMKK